MTDFWKLVQNENMKIYRRAATWVMFAFVVFLPVLMALVAYLVPGGNKPSNWGIMYFASVLLFNLVTIFTVVKAAEAVAGEFTQGTIKLLLIRPWRRSAILLAKYVAVLLFGLIMAATVFVVAFAAGTLFFGYTSAPMDLPEAARNDPWSYMALWYLYQWISLVVVVTFGFMMSAAFRSSGLAIGLSIFILFANSLITHLLSLIDKPVIKFMLFPHLNLTSYLEGGTGPLPNHPMTLGFSLGVLAAYFVLFNVVSWTVFTRRDVT